MTDDGYFDEHVAARYDEQSPELGSMFSDEAITPVVDKLVELAAGGPALEFAIGTGRIALPLAGRGVEVHGIELSQAMLRRLRAKPGGDSDSGHASATWRRRAWKGSSASSTWSSTRSTT